ncbi:hypothetical protein [Halarchaeum nitratireducens]|uniref:Uncharacterized protein n=1 Tax=Halarchaeum nitratireducens TaxID=489913 RepID=A0A830G774_9EURY|nr:MULTISPECIES: hypothetical protein [Halarchaeum]MBP2251966.1 hypothetical protein [Halarchaeum solikamskense]GGN05748.1 hypothetical protein GCM10009021_00810 [Halarchaeum nitratireducens]
MRVKDDVEACGRCAMSSAADLTSGRSPFADANVIEVEESEVRAVSRHVVALGRLKTALNEWARALTYGR